MRLFTMTMIVNISHVTHTENIHYSAG